MDRRAFLKAGAAGLAAGALGAGCTNQKEVVSSNLPSATIDGHAQKMLTGSFMNVLHSNVWNMAYSDETILWKEENWRAVIRDMHDIGMDTVIWTACAFWGRPFFPGYEWKVGKVIRFMGCDDPLKVVAHEADRLGMNVFYGVGQTGRTSQVRDYHGMEKPWPDVWFNWNTALAEAIVERYGDHSCFAGLYIPYEITFKEEHVELYNKLIGQHLRPVVGRVPILASPGNIGKELPGDQINVLPSMCERMGIDILAPQDCAGRYAAGDNEKPLKNIRLQAESLEKAKKLLAGTKCRLWANCETFCREINPLTHKPKSPSGRKISIAAPIERVKHQIAVQAPHARKLITWIYPGVMNKRTKLVNIGHSTGDKLYHDYVAYLKAEFPGRFTHL